MESYKVDLATPNDSKTIWKIRFERNVIQQSLNAEVVDFKKHNQWFQDKYFKNNDNKCFVLRLEGKVVGYCCFDLDQYDIYLVSIAICTDFQRKGCGHILFSSALEQFQTIKPILAIIKKSNSASLKLFQKNGFIVYQEDSDNYYLKR